MGERYAATMDRIDEQATDVRHPTPVPRRGRGVRAKEES
jgi:hypothetical protein